MVTDLASLRPPASTRRIDGCAAVRASRDASVVPAGPANCYSAFPEAYFTAYPTAIVKLTANDDDVVRLR